MRSKFSTILSDMELEELDRVLLSLALLAVTMPNPEKFRSY